MTVPGVPAAPAVPGHTSGLWAKRCKCDPINDRSHQVSTAWDILDHVRERAAVWALPRLLLQVGERLRVKAKAQG